MSSKKRDIASKSRALAEQIASQYWLDPENYPRDVLRLKFEDPLTVRAALRDAPSFIMRGVVTGTPFPASFAAFSQRVSTHFTKDLAAELVWTSEVLGRFAHEINKFIKSKQHFDQAILRQDYTSAHNSLEAILRDFGYSFWYINARLLLAEYRGGLKENREFLQTIQESNSAGFIQLVASYFSQRAERSLSSTNYDKEVEHFCRQHVGDSDSDTEPGLFHFKYTVNFVSIDKYDHLAYILQRDSINPIIDRYAGFVRVLSVLQAMASPDLQEAVRRCVMWSAERFDDPRLHNLRHLNEPRTPLRKTELGESLLCGFDAYTAGDYEKSQSLAQGLLLSNPDCFEFYELYTRASLYLRKDLDNPFPAQSVAGEILQATFDVLSKSDKTADSLKLLRKLACSLDGMRLADQLFSFVLIHEGPRNPIKPQVYASINGLMLTAKSSSLFAVRADSLRFLHQLSKVHPGGASITLFDALHSEKILSKPPVGIPSTRWQMYSAYTLKRSGNYEEAAASYRRLLTERDSSPPLREGAVLGLLECLLSLGRHREYAQLVVDTYLDQKAFLLSTSLTDVIEECQSTPAHSISDDICWPILCYIHYAARGELRKNENLHFACEDFLSAEGVDRPSKLSAVAAKFDTRKLVLFLRYVCVPEILDFSIAYESSAELDDERIAICQRLLSLDPANADAYSREISQLTQAGMIRRAMLHIDESKIYIDIKGITQSLDKSFRERFDRFIAYSRLNDHLRTSLALEGISFQEEASVVVVSDAGILQFGELFSEIKNRFISSNEYGLDSYLSVRIRHGTLSGQIRSQFEKENLITRRSRSDGAYDKNAFWADRVFSHYNEDIENAADIHLRDFSQKIDSIIEVVKSKWIQIKGPSNSGEGLFDFDYSQQQILDLYVRNIGIDGYNDFLQIAFSALWSRTGENLKTVVDRIRGELRAQLTEALDIVAARVFALNDEIRHSPFGDAVTRCRTGIQNEIETISAWFSAVSEKTAPDFRFNLLAETATEIIRRCFPTPRFSPVISADSDVLFRGEAFAGFVDVLFILFENIIRHSRLDPTRTNGTLSPELSINVESDRLILQVSNALGASVEIPVLRDKIMELNRIKSGTSSLKAIRTEGGSGYHKLHKLIRHDLSRGEDYLVLVRIDESTMFNVTISMGLQGLLHAHIGD